MPVDARYKSLFLLPAAAATALLLLASLMLAALSGSARVAWVGASIACLPLPLLLARLTFYPVERTSDNLPFWLLISAIGVIVTVWEQHIEGVSGWLPTLAALAAAGIFAAYVFWYSRFGRLESASLAVGGRLPEFSLEDSEGKVFRSSQLLGAPAVIMFYQGNWSPFCMAQIRELASRYDDLKALGIRVVLISPQAALQTRELSSRYEVPFDFLLDGDNELAMQLGIAASNAVPVGMPGGYASDSVLPTLLVTNANGTIVFSDQTDNYRVRPEPDIFLAILRRSGAIAT